MNYKMIRYVMGQMLRVEGVLLLIPMMVSILYREHVAYVFAGTMCILWSIGGLLTWKRPKEIEFYAKEGMVIVAGTWLMMSICGALPFYFSGEIPSFVDCFFETVSGFTTTGSTILADIEKISNGLLFWRSFTHWIGGMGVLVFAFALIPQNNGNNMYIMKAEVPGHKVGKLVSKLSSTARILYGIYIFMTIVEVIFLYAGGMSFFDCWIHAFSTAGTGGFSSKNASIAYYNSAYIEAVISAFMILFGINFQLYYFILLKDIKGFFRSEELKYYLWIIGIATFMIALNIRHSVDGYFSALRSAGFQVASIITTTGFVTRDYEQWPFFSQGILLLLMYLGAMSGSTGGGIKTSRIILLFKDTYIGIRKMIQPNRILSTQFEGESVGNEVMRGVHVYIGLYLIILASSMMLLLYDGLDLVSTFASVSCCLNNVGPGLGLTGPVKNFSSLSDFTKIILSFDMLAGRLELFPMVVIMMPSTWKCK